MNLFSSKSTVTKLYVPKLRIANRGVAYPGTGFDEPGTSTGKNPGLTSLEPIYCIGLHWLISR